MSDAAVRELAEKILARSEYANASGAQVQAQSWLLRLLERILHGFTGLELMRDSSPVLYWLIVLGIAATCAGLLAHVTWTIWIAMTAPAPVARTVSADSPDLALEAESLAAGGRYLEAAHRLMLASFRTLAERSVIELRPEHSNRWIRAALRRSTLGGNLAAELDSLVERTERRWFGDRSRDSSNDPEIYARWRTAFAQLSMSAPLQ
jgi:hypothetical protein